MTTSTPARLLSFEFPFRVRKILRYVMYRFIVKVNKTKFRIAGFAFFFGDLAGLGPQCMSSLDSVHSDF